MVEFFLRYILKVLTGDFGREVRCNCELNPEYTFPS